MLKLLYYKCYNFYIITNTNETNIKTWNTVEIKQT